MIRLADVPVVIDADDARRAAEAELSDPAYALAQPSWFDRAVGWLAERLADLVEGAANVVPGGGFGVVVLIAVLVLVIVVVRLRVGPLARAARRPGVVFADRTRTAQDYRDAAEQAFAAGDPGAAVRDRFRAVVRSLEERGVLDERAGRTADEAAREAGARLPSAQDALRQGAELFDAVHYGGRPATAEDYHRLAGLDDLVRRSRPEVPA
ncbi:hypothetical protein GCM10017786_67520 [Amycolatopsis deserti]|uniref:Protein-glutamine gamma-glutamyltransferase-like C-terminal domain-containing protein n=1 Tax=Amycolatopsis deserti TaxID=185696 RepID=A0ABQ3JH43_9PSEU|nr:DUF4129 domain-containing protein [Amycolatopsis deserti]GHF23787.1 hypothetical protein GCM10017786_67520 [Amycolatopsis deserti]